MGVESRLSDEQWKDLIEAVPQLHPDDLGELVLLIGHAYLRAVGTGSALVKAAERPIAIMITVRPAVGEIMNGLRMLMNDH